MEQRSLRHQKDLWVISQHNDDIGVIDGNPHTFPGRFLILWASLGESYSCSIGELSLLSPYAELWLQGYLSGGEPAPWFDDPYEYEEGDPRTDLWRRSLLLFQLTGTWKTGRRCSENDHEMLPSEPSGFTCHSHSRPPTTSSQWPRVSEGKQPPELFINEYNRLCNIILLRRN